jgi:hypothetical protein
MSKKDILKQFFHRTSHPTVGDKRFGRVLLLCAVGLLIAGFGRICSIGNDSSSILFDWFVYLSLASILVVDILAIVWRVSDIIKQMKIDEDKK